jgi:hypothetical protein
MAVLKHRNDGGWTVLASEKLLLVFCKSME